MKAQYLIIYFCQYLMLNKSCASVMYTGLERGCGLFYPTPTADCYSTRFYFLNISMVFS